MSTSPITYRRQKADGSVEVYAQSDGSVGFPRRVFLSQVIDPRGNAATLTYDGQQRLVSITDIIGLTSSFTYDANYLVNALTTPYGTTTFAYTAPGAGGAPRFIEVTDPMGFREREEWVEPSPPIQPSEPAQNVPQGMPLAPANSLLDFRNSFYWSKSAYVEAGCTPSGGCDYLKARMRHFTHLGNSSIKSTVAESQKHPYERTASGRRPAVGRLRIRTARDRMAATENGPPKIGGPSLMAL